MAGIISKYETIFIVNATLGEDEINSVVDKFKALIEANGTVESVDVWGKRRLAYPINDMNEGFYVLVNFTAPREFPAELDRVYNITEGVLRSIIVNKDEK